MFHFIVDDFFCRAVPIVTASTPTQHELTHYVLYDLDGKRKPTSAGNVTSYTLDIMSDGLITFANNAECPLIFNVSEVLKNDQSTPIPSSQWS